MSDSNEIIEDTQTEDKVDAKEMRLAQWKQAISSELQPFLTEAAKIQNIINKSKTASKKQYYQKKFKKIQQSVLQYADLLQKLEKMDGTLPSVGEVVNEPITDSN